MLSKLKSIQAFVVITIIFVANRKAAANGAAEAAADKPPGLSDICKLIYYVVCDVQLLVRGFTRF